MRMLLLVDIVKNWSRFPGWGNKRRGWILITPQLCWGQVIFHPFWRFIQSMQRDNLARGRLNLKEHANPVASWSNPTVVTRAKVSAGLETSRLKVRANPPGNRVVMGSSRSASHYKVTRALIGNDQDNDWYQCNLTQHGETHQVQT